MSSNKFVLIKYYEESATNAKIITTPSDYFKGEINSKNILELLNKDDKWLEKLNPITTIEYYNAKEDK